MGKSGHAKRSALFAEDYLTKLNINESDKQIIVHAIMNHSTGNYLQSIVGASLTFADKIDMQKARMMRFLDGNYFHENIKHMLDIEISVNEENIIVNIVTDGLFDYLSLSDYSKMITKPMEMAKYLGRNCLFSIDGKLIDLYEVVTTQKCR